MREFTIGDVKRQFSILWLVLAGFFNAVVPANAQVNVTQFHNHESRDGLYIDSAFTQSAAVNLTHDLNSTNDSGRMFRPTALYRERRGGQSDDHCRDGIE